MAAIMGVEVKQKDIESWADAEATWKFASEPCEHLSTRRVNLGTYIDGGTGGTIWGKQCKGCKGLLYH